MQPKNPQVAAYLGMSVRSLQRLPKRLRDHAAIDLANGVNNEIANLIGVLHTEIYKHNEITGRYAHPCFLFKQFFVSVERESIIDLCDINKTNLELVIEKIRSLTYA